MIDEPHWLTRARLDIGLREIPGAPTAPRIAAWLQRLRAWWKDDETPWCGVAMAAWMDNAGFPLPPAWYRARSWAEWGSGLPQPAVGAVAVLTRQGGGHVGLVTGTDSRGRLLLLGGNQGNAVSIAAFDRDRVIAYRWPPGERMRWTLYDLPMAKADASTSEA